MSVRARLSDNVLDALMRYDFPGNVRELEHMVEQAVALVQSGLVTADDLLSPSQGITSSRTPPSGHPAGDGEGRRRMLADVVDTAERQAIEGALDETAGNREQAADMLGISPTTLWRKMTRLGMHVRDPLAASSRSFLQVYTATLHERGAVCGFAVVAF